MMDLNNCSATLEPLSNQEWLDRYDGGKRRLYADALKSLETCDFVKRDACVKAFVKAEKLTSPDKDPRMIQARSPRFNALLGPYISAYERRLYACRSARIGRGGSGAVFAKGKNRDDRGADLLKKFDKFNLKHGPCVALSLDESRFDAHVHLKALKIEHEAYIKAFKSPHREKVRRLLQYQCRNKCSTRHGLRYTVRGRRMSGDTNTACGNCLLSVCMIIGALHDTNFPYDLYDDGDDCVLIVRVQDLQWCLTKLPGIYLGFGQELKVENVTRHFEQIKFCQSRPVRIGTTAVLCPTPEKVLAQAYVGCREFNDPRQRENYLTSLADAYILEHSGIPMLEAFHRGVRAHLTGLRVKLTDWWWDHVARKESRSGISDLTRVSFGLAFGFSPEFQIAFEEACAKLPKLCGLVVRRSVVSGLLLPS